MSKARVPKNIRLKVAAAAHYRCAYCQTAERIIGPLLEVDHIVPESLGGTGDEHNLTLACPLCNSHKSNLTEALDPISGELFPLFDPHNHRWEEHFEWEETGTVVRGKTAIGRATVAALQMNHPDVVTTRQLWVSVGWHPPENS